jgi:hypothetical protein
MKEFCALIKVGELEHLTALREKGLLYCNTLGHFSALEDKVKRGDPLEGITGIINLNGGSFRIKDVDADASTYSEPIAIHTGQALHSADEKSGNIFSLYSIQIGSEGLSNEHNISDDARAFGTHYLIIKDYYGFLHRVEKN